MIHWTRQIKEVLSSQDTFEAAENSGPLEEIEFWHSRCADLSGISEQLDKPGVKRIQSILEHSKSSYVAPFLKLSKLIQVWVNLLSPDIKMHILLTVLYTFLMELVRRICLNIKTSYPW